MKKNFLCIVGLVGTLLLVVSPSFLFADEPEFPDIAVDGVLGLDGGTDNGWLAIKVNFPETEALNGILWYNNDGLVTYPAILVGTGYVTSPGNMEEMVVIAEDVVGASSGWSAAEFIQPVAALMDGLYVVFEFPEGVDFDSEGEGGGPAVGYVSELNTCPGWISGDGENWLKLHRDFSFAVEPVLVPVEEGMLTKGMLHLDQDGELPKPVEKPYMTAGPNPFNPKTVIRFGLPFEARVKINIYDIRGARVTQLINEVIPSGHYSIPWMGRDHAGRPAASGLYFARLTAEHVTLTQRMMLIR